MRLRPSTQVHVTSDSGHNTITFEDLLEAYLTGSDLGGTVVTIHLDSDPKEDDAKQRRNKAAQWREDIDALVDKASTKQAERILHSKSGNLSAMSNDEIQGRRRLAMRKIEQLATRELEKVAEALQYEHRVRERHCSARVEIRERMMEMNEELLEWLYWRAYGVVVEDH